MFDAILMLLFLLVFIPSVICLVRNREVPSARRLSAGLGVAGALLAPSAATFICELLSSIFTVAFVFFMLFGGLGLLFKAIFR